jgi:hypothetical protein
MSNGMGWLADGKYRQVVESLVDADPRLRQRDPKAVTQNIPYTDNNVRLVLLEMQTDGSFTTTAEFKDPIVLQKHFQTKVKSPGRRAVYILEGIGPGFVGAVGEHFSLHPSMFVEHERVVVMNMTWRGESDGTSLPSVLQSRNHKELRYYEALTFNSQPTSFRWVCGDTGRHIGVSRTLNWVDKREPDTFSDVGVVRRKVGVWSRETDDGGWECKFHASFLLDYIRINLHPILSIFSFSGQCGLTLPGRFGRL